MNTHISIKKYFLALFLALIPAQQIHAIDLHDKDTQTAIALTSIIGLGAYAGYVYAQQPTPATIDIKDLAHTKLNFPTDFWGVGTSSTQSEKTNNNNGWSRSYLDTIPTKSATIAPNYACDSWTHWKDDIDKVIHLG